MKIIEYLAVFQELHDQFYVFFPDIPSVEIFGTSIIASKVAAEKSLREVTSKMNKLPTMTSINELEELYPEDVLSLIQLKI